MSQEKLSTANLQRSLIKLAKFKDKRSDVEVSTAIENLPVYHCVRESNIISVIKTQEIRIKNIILEGEMTNNTSDFYQGFDRHISMGIGRPWVEYGPYSFSFGLEHLSKGALFFKGDPWLWKSDKLSKRFLLRDDFITYAKELCKKNVYIIGRRWAIQLPWKKDLHKLCKHNFSKWEAKNTETLKILDADEFFVWNKFDEFIYMITNGLVPLTFLLGMGLAIVLMRVGGLI